VRISDQGEIEVVTQEGEKLVVRLYVPMSNASHALADRRIFPYDEGLMIPETRVKFPLPAQK
jgi:hypothetical protein